MAKRRVRIKMTVRAPGNISDRQIEEETERALTTAAARQRQFGVEITKMKVEVEEQRTTSNW